MHHFQSGPHSKGDTTMYVGNAHSALVEMQTGVVDGRVPNVASIDTPSAMPPVAELTYQTAFNLLFFVGAVVLLLVVYKMYKDQQAARRKAAAAESWTTLYASDDEYIIYEKDDKGVVMLSHGGESNLWMGQCDPNNPLDFGLEYFRSQVTVALATGNHQRVLVLGLGIGAIPNTLRAIRPEMVIDIVEIDAAVIEGAMKYANVVQDDRMHVYEADAAQFVRRPDRQSYYDVVILDCFDPEGIPAVFHAKEFYENAVACLRPQGVFSTNLIWTLKEAPEIKDHLRECLAAPLSIYNSSESNCAIFGRAVADPAGPLVLDDVMHAAQAVDAENVLPYFLEPQVKRAAPLFVSKTARRVPSGVEA
jgi:hypothetical protein